MRTIRKIRIGTRESALALFQAREVQRQIEGIGIDTEMVEMVSEGDVDLETPLYEMGIQGIFTKTLDMALLQNRIDVAVHSVKDMPTRLAKGLMLGAVLKRGPATDALVLPVGSASIDPDSNAVVATSSLRRRNQWLHRYPHHTIESLRGNIETRLQKLDRSSWSGAIFAEAVFQRLGISTHKVLSLDWMLPAPAQGAIGVACREEDETARQVCRLVHHEETGICIGAERDFLAALHGGCAVPIAAHAQVKDHKLHFMGNVVSLDARRKIEVELEVEVDRAAEAGRRAAKKMLSKGAETIIKTFRAS